MAITEILTKKFHMSRVLSYLVTFMYVFYDKEGQWGERGVAILSRMMKEDRPDLSLTPPTSTCHFLHIVLVVFLSQTLTPDPVSNPPRNGSWMTSNVKASGLHPVLLLPMSQLLLLPSFLEFSSSGSLSPTVPWFPSCLFGCSDSS